MSKQIRYLVLSAFVLIPLLAEQSFAQFVSTIGTSTFNGQTFTCRSYTDKQDIIIVANGKSRTVSKTTAQKQAQKTIETLSKRIKNTSGIVKEKNARLKKLFKQNVPTPKVVDEIVLLQDQIPKLNGLIDLNKSQQAELKSIIAAIKNCGKGPQIGNGTNGIYNVNATLPKTGWQVFFVLAAYVFPVDHSAFPNRGICVSRGGGAFTYEAYKPGVCQTFYDGFFTSNPTGICAPGTESSGVIFLGGGSGRFSSGKYDEAVADANAALSTVIQIKAPANGAC